MGDRIHDSHRRRAGLILAAALWLAGCENGTSTVALVDQTASVVSVTPGSGVVADAAATATITVSLKTQQGGPLSGATVELTASGTGNTLTPSSGITDANGAMTATLASTAAGTKTITATVRHLALAVVLDQKPTVPFTADPGNVSAASSAVTVSAASGVVADGVASSTVTVTVLDSNGNSVSGIAVAITATGTGHTITLASPVTDASGQVTATVNSTVAELKTLTATAFPPAGGSVPLTTQPTVEFVGNPASISAGNSLVVASPATGTLADGVAASTITVTVRDVFNNPVAGQTVQLAATGTGNSLTQPGSTTNSSGVATATLASTDSQTKTLTATVNPGPSQVVLMQTPTAEFVGDGLDADDVRLFYGEGTVAQVRQRDWDDSAGTWSAESSTPTAGATVKWTVNRIKSALSFEHLMAALSDNGSSTELDMLRFNGSAWVVDWTATAITSANAGMRGFDLIYEASSGQAMAVYSDNTANPVYRTWDGSTWSAELDVFTTAPGSGVVNWVALAARPGTDEIALTYLDANSDLHAVIWTGSVWDETNTETTLSTTMSTLTESRAFDLAYESSSGDLLVVWGHTFAPEEMEYATKAAGASTWVTTSWSGSLARAKVVRLAAEAGSDRIAAAYTEGNGDNDTVGAIWNGTTFTDIVEVDGISASDDRDVAIAWVGTSGTAVLIYKDTDGGGSFDWVRWTSGGGWVVQADQTVTGIGDMQSVLMRSFGAQNKLMAILSGASSGLWAATYDGTSWTVTNSGAALETNLSSITTEPFSLAVK